MRLIGQFSQRRADVSIAVKVANAKITQRVESHNRGIKFSDDCFYTANIIGVAQVKQTVCVRFERVNSEIGIYKRPIFSCPFFQRSQVVL